MRSKENLTVDRARVESVTVGAGVSRRRVGCTSVHDEMRVAGERAWSPPKVSVKSTRTIIRHIDTDALTIYDSVSPSPTDTNYQPPFTRPFPQLSLLRSGSRSIESGPVRHKFASFPPPPRSAVTSIE